MPPADQDPLFAGPALSDREDRRGALVFDPFSAPTAVRLVYLSISSNAKTFA